MILYYSPTSTGIIDMDTDTALVLPMEQMQKDPTGVEGMIRYNEDSDKVEVYDGTDWTQVGGSTGAISTQAFTGDDTTTAFTLNSPADSATVMVTLNGVVQEPNTGI